MSNIFVTNHSDKPLKDGFCGTKYEFKVGETVEIPVEAAAHIFGYGNDNKEPYLARLGWAKTSNDLEEGLKHLAKWELSTEPPKKNQSLSPLVERVPLPSQKRAGGKILSVAA
jgi:hypothetical protein